MEKAALATKVLFYNAWTRSHPGQYFLNSVIVAVGAVILRFAPASTRLFAENGERIR